MLRDNKQPWVTIEVRTQKEIWEVDFTSALRNSTNYQNIKAYVTVLIKLFGICLKGDGKWRNDC